MLNQVTYALVGLVSIIQFVLVGCLTGSSSSKTTPNNIAMSPLPIISHSVNIIVAGFLGCMLFSRNNIAYPTISKRLNKVYGPISPARQILACVYLSIAILSISALSNDDIFDMISIPLFTMQIVYKVLTLGSVGVNSPVVIANLGISFVHIASIRSLL
jgi:hypothetical protein